MYSKEKNKLSKLISNILKEDAEFRLKREVVKTTLRLICTQDTHVPDLLTRIRVLPSVAVVGQRERVVRPEKGRATLIIYVKYLPTVSTIGLNQRVPYKTPLIIFATDLISLSDIRNLLLVL